MGFSTIKNLLRTFPEVGRIKIGEPGPTRTSQGGKEFRIPKKLDHFQVVTRFRGDDGKFVKDTEIHEKVGEAPRELDVVLMYDDPSLNFPHRLTCYAGSRLYCQGDGEQAERLDSAGIYQPRACPCPLLLSPEKAEENKGKAPSQALKCKPYGCLRVQLPLKLSSVGCYGFRTTSQETISNIISMMEAILLRVGVLAGIPLKLRMYPTTDQTPNGASQNWKVMLDLPDGGWAAVEEAAKGVVKHRLATRTDMAMLEAAHRRELQRALEAPDDVIAELYPEQVALLAAPGEIERAETERTAKPDLEPQAPEPAQVAPKPEPPQDGPKAESAPELVAAAQPAAMPNAVRAAAEAAPERLLDDFPPPENVPDPDEVAFAEASDDPARQQEILKRLAKRKGANLSKLTKPLDRFGVKDRWDLLKHLLTKPDVHPAPKAAAPEPAPWANL